MTPLGNLKIQGSNLATITGTERMAKKLLRELENMHLSIFGF
jgi:hypothetical protein